LYNGGLTIVETANALGLARDTVRRWVRNLSKPWIIRDLGEPKKIAITPELMKLFGYYLAEGCSWYAKRSVKESSLSFSFNVKEKDKVNYVIKIMKKYFNVSPTSLTSPEKNEVCIVYHRKRIANLFKNLFGSNAHDKKIPSFFYKLPKEHIVKFLEGYASDGYISKNGSLSLFTVNKRLAESIIWLLKLHGINAVLLKKTSKERTLRNNILKPNKYYEIKIPSSENPLNNASPTFTSTSRRIPARIIQTAYRLLKPKLNAEVKASKYNYIIRKEGLVRKENAKELIELINSRSRCCSKDMEKIKKIVNSDLGSAMVKEISIEDYDGYVYDLCGTDNEAFFGGEVPILLHNSKHGPISIIEENVPVFFICPNDEVRKEVLGNIMEMRARGAKIITLCEEGDKEVINQSDDWIEMPKEISAILSPILYIVPLQLFAYYTAVEKGLDPDKPRNLAKSVTVP
jgi:intein/homing endonuclease